MRSKFDSIINKILNESADQFSIGNALRNFLANLDPKTKTKSGALVSEEFQDLLNEYDEIINKAKDKAKENADQPEAIESLLWQLLQQLSSD